MLKEIKRVLEDNDGVILQIESEADPSDGSVSLSAKLTNKYSGKVYFSLSWYYDFGKLMEEVNKRCLNITS